MKVQGETNRLDILNSNRFKVGMTAGYDGFQKENEKKFTIKRIQDSNGLTWSGSA